jgi:hypothetical protein
MSCDPGSDGNATGADPDLNPDCKKEDEDE